MAYSRIPLTILGGSDQKPGQLPSSGSAKRPITGCKGIDLRIGDRPLACYIAEQFLESGAFGPIYVVGPLDAYQEVVVSSSISEVFDSDAGFSGNIRTGIEAMRERHPLGQLAMVTCDILPTLEDIGTCVADYRSAAPNDLWFPLVRVPEQASRLGASAWKPRYRISVPGKETEPLSVPVLPGHLAIFDPEAIRLNIIYRLLDIAYQSRNRPVLYRRAFVTRQMILGLLYRDLLNVLSLRLPTLTWDTAVHGGRAALHLSDGTLSQANLEKAARRIFVRRAHRRVQVDSVVRTPILEALSLARDIDTLEEAAALGVVPASITPGESLK